MINSCILVLLLSVCCVRGNMTSNTCTRRDISTAYLDAAIDVITRAKYHMPSDANCTDCPDVCPECPTKECPECPTKECPECPTKECPECPTKECPECPTKECPECPKCPMAKAVDCGDLLKMGHRRSGVYEVWPRNRMAEGKPIAVYCDMETDGGGWTVIQRRGDFGSPKDYFYREWRSYKEGFGTLEKDFWLGNDNIFVLTNEKYYSVRFDLMDVEKNRRYAHYAEFWIDNEVYKYTLHISSYSGNAGDAMAKSNNRAFTTKDRDNDGCYLCNCAVNSKAAWWYDQCSDANLNGLYYKGKYYGAKDGVFWTQWKGHFDSLESTEIKVRPKHFTASFASQT